MTLEDPYIMDTTKWKATGNLLGKTLMHVKRGLIFQQDHPKK